MSLAEYAQAVDPIFFVVSVIVVLGLFLMVVFGVFVTIMGLILSPGLDAKLFNERWFTNAELVLHATWPLSLRKTMQYLLLIAFPSYMKKRRFKGLDIKIDSSPLLIFASKLCIFIGLFTIFLSILFGAIGLYSMIEAEFFKNGL